MEILTGEQMRNVDRRAIDGMGIPSLQLMEAAGRGVAEKLLAHYPDARDHDLFVVCGKGNNGGDGLVAARHLKTRGVAPRVLILGDTGQLKEDPAANLRAARDHGVDVREIPDEAAWAAIRDTLCERCLVLDAILGTGVRGGARGLAARVIEDLNASQVRTVAIDLPSGLNADSTQVEGVAVRAERTYTLCRPKLALVLGPSSAHTGRWSVVPIGIPDDAVAAEDPRIAWLDAAELSSLLPRRAEHSHKGTYGHLLAVAGSRGKSGAAVLLARGALRSGVGLVTVATSASGQPAVAAQQAEVMTEVLPETGGGALGPTAAARAAELLEQREALALGPGLGTEPETREEILSLFRNTDRPTVIDADGLNAFALQGETALSLLRGGGRELVLTPHPGEAARLLGTTAREVQADRLASAERLAQRTEAVVVLKGHRTVIASPAGRIAINSSGNPGMATAGVGDVLTGMVGAFLARRMSGWDAARLAVYAHGDAGDRAARVRGQESLIASDLLDQVPEALAALAG